MRKEQLQHMRTAKVQASLCIRTVSPEHMLFANVLVSDRSSENFSQRTRCGIAKKIDQTKSPKSLFSRSGSYNINKRAIGPRLAHLIKTAIAYLQMPLNFHRYCTATTTQI